MAFEGILTCTVCAHGIRLLIMTHSSPLQTEVPRASIQPMMCLQQHPGPQMCSAHHLWSPKVTLATKRDLPSAAHLTYIHS